MQSPKDAGTYLPLAAMQASEIAGSTPEPWGETTVVGKPLPRVDAWDRVSGAAVYARDLSLPEMLHAAVLRCPHAHALVKRVDVSKAAEMPGVHAVLTPTSPGATIPWYPDATGQPRGTLLTAHCRFAGEDVAAVAAETPHQAADAVRAIVVEYEVLQPVSDMERALDANAPAIHEGGNRHNDTVRYARGDADAAFAAADVVVEETYRTATQLHTPMEVHGSVAHWEGRHLTVWDTTQGVFDVRAELARTLELPLANVRVISRYMGGGFGSKIGLNKHTVIAALLSRATGRPVKLFLSREETFLCVGNRPPTRYTVRIGASTEGAIAAIEVRALGSGGAYFNFPTSGFLAANLYRCANVRVEHDNVCTNVGPGRAFRAPGFPPCAWALEQTIDILAARLGMDPLELRLANLATVSQIHGGAPYTSNGLERCLREGAREFGWSEARSRQRQAGAVVRGVGVAAGMWGYPGEPNATAIVTFFADGSVILNTGASDIGTGTKTILAMVVAEELGVPLARIAIEHADTGTTQYAPTSGGSQTVVANAPAVRAAAIDVRRQLLELAAAQLQRPVAELTLTEGAVGAPDGTRLAVAEIESLATQQAVIGVGRRHPHPEGKVPLPFVAQFAEVEVDTRTGEVRLVRLIAAHDSGRVMNLLTYRNQVFGGVTMGLGYALTEGRVVDRSTAQVLNANWHDYKLPTTMDMPTGLECLPIDPHDTECNTTGTKGLGEPATIPTAAAIGNAICDALGARATETPVTPARVLELLARRRASPGTSPGGR